MEGRKPHPETPEAQLTDEQREYIAKVTELVDAEAFVMDMCLQAAKHLVDSASRADTGVFNQFGPDHGAALLVGTAGRLAGIMYGKVREQLESTVSPNARHIRRGGAPRG